MIKINSYSLYKYYNFSNFYQKNKLDINYMFIYKHNLNKFYSFNFEINKNLNRLILSLKNNKIKYIFLFYDNKNVIHSSGVCLSKKPDDKFFYDFQEKKYAVVLSTYTNILYRRKKFYAKALKLQIKNIIEKYKINDIFISTLRTKKKLSAFETNGFKKFSSGLLLSLFNKIHIYIILNNFLKIRIFFNDNLIFRFK